MRGKGRGGDERGRRREGVCKGEGRSKGVIERVRQLGSRVYYNCLFFLLLQERVLCLSRRVMAEH